MEDELGQGIGPPEKPSDKIWIIILVVVGILILGGLYGASGGG